MIEHLMTHYGGLVFVLCLVALAVSGGLAFRAQSFEVSAKLISPAALGIGGGWAGWSVASGPASWIYVSAGVVGMAALMWGQGYRIGFEMQSLDRASVGTDAQLAASVVRGKEDATVFQAIRGSRAHSHRWWRPTVPSGPPSTAMDFVGASVRIAAVTIIGPLGLVLVIVPGGPIVPVAFILVCLAAGCAVGLARRTRWAGELKTTDGSRVVQVIDAYRPSLMPMPDASDATWMHFDGTNRWVAFDARVGYARTLVVALRRDYPLPDVPSIDRKTFRRIQWTGERVRAASGELALSADARR